MARIGICGLDCSACYRYQATQSGDAEELERVKRFYVRIGLLQEAFPAANLACSGCGPANRCAYPDVRSCAISRAVSNCGCCSDYPCDKIKVVFTQKATWIDDIRSKCTDEEYATLKKAFYSRQSNLDGVFKDHRRSG